MAVFSRKFTGLMVASGPLMVMALTPPDHEWYGMVAILQAHIYSFYSYSEQPYFRCTPWVQYNHWSLALVTLKSLVLGA